nr:MFS transporter [Nocardioides sp. zg-1308]
MAVFHRSSLGVAGIIASERFDISATSLATFTVLQLVVYAGMQVPVGVLLDRFGSRAMLLSGLVLMTLGQLSFAFAESFPTAVAARAAVGAGDAMIFISVIRLVTVWFLVRQGPMVTQVTGLSGQLGAIAAAGPLAYLLHELGWTRAFALTSSIGLVLLVVVALLVKDSPYRRDDVVAIKLRALAQSVRTVWGNPGTRLGMWSHFVSQFSSTVFALLWGYPFLVQGLGWSTGAASTLLMAMTAWAVVSGLALARLVSRLPYYRSWIVVGVVVAMVVPWTAVLLWSGAAPDWLVVVMAFATASGGPAAMVAFDLARSFTPAHETGRANGLVNVGGFTASLLTMGLIGIVLDLSSSGGMGSYTLDDFKLAMAVQYLFWALGVVQVLRYRRRGIAHLARVHPGSIEQMKAGQPFVHPGIGTEGV